MYSLQRWVGFVPRVSLYDRTHFILSPRRLSSFPGTMAVIWTLHRGKAWASVPRSLADRRHTSFTCSYDFLFVRGDNHPPLQQFMSSQRRFQVRDGGPRKTFPEISLVVRAPDVKKPCSHNGTTTVPELPLLVTCLSAPLASHCTLLNNGSCLRSRPRPSSKHFQHAVNTCWPHEARFLFWRALPFQRQR